MKKSELIQRLQEIDGDPDIVVSRDEEGNGFKRLAVVQESLAQFDDYEVDLVHPDDIEDGEYDEEDIKLFELVVVLWP